MTKVMNLVCVESGLLTIGVMTIVYAVNLIDQIAIVIK